MPITLPRTSVVIERQASLAQVAEQRVLLVGQKQDAGTHVSGQLAENIADNNALVASAFGARSHIAQMIRAFRAINKVTALDVIALDDAGSGVAAEAAIAFTGTATETGRIHIEIGSGNRHRYALDIASGATATAVGAALNTLIGADTRAPFTATASTGTVTITSANAGTLANAWTVRVQGAVAGIAAAITGFASGANDPSLTDVLDVVGARRYQTIVWPSVFETTELEDFLDARFNADNAVLDGVAIQTVVDTATNILAAATALNSPSFVVLADRPVDEADLVGTAAREIPDVIATTFAAVRSLRLTDAATLAAILTTGAPLDQFGGSALASLPYFNTVLPGVEPALPRDEWTTGELAAFTDGGVATFGPNRAYSAVICGEVVTTNLTDGAGNPDTSFKYLNTVDTMSLIRETFDTRLRTKFAQSRLTAGDLVPGRDMVNEPLFRAACKEIYQDLAEATLVQAGSAAIRDFNENLLITVSIPLGRVTFAMAPLLVTGLRVILGTISVNFGS